MTSKTRKREIRRTYLSCLEYGWNPGEKTRQAAEEMVRLRSEQWTREAREAAAAPTKAR